MSKRTTSKHRTAESILSAKSRKEEETKAAAPVVEVVEVEEVEEVEDEDATGSGSGTEEEDDEFGTGLLDGDELDNVLSNYLMYQHDDGTVLNITDAILLTKESIDRQTETIQKLCDLLAAKLK
jgi:ethanolamine utilization protein EutQ (cupin superfamily)